MFDGLILYLLKLRPPFSLDGARSLRESVVRPSAIFYALFKVCVHMCTYVPTLGSFSPGG